jgi:hypothetical protein
MKHLAIATLAGLLALPHTVHAAPKVERVRGTIETVEPDKVSIRTIDGQTETVTLTPQTRYASLVRSSLSAITDGSFIGTATKGDNPPTALEVHIFPESMRGTGEGHRDWDTIPDTLAGGARVKSAMTNGTVKTSSGAGPRVKSAMTNGTVASRAGAGGATTLVVTYGKDQSLTILVPPQAPIVAYEPADRAIVQAGGKIFLTAERDGDKLTAVRVAVGRDGLTPPQ